LNHPIVVLIIVGICLYLVFIFQRWRRNQPPAVVQKTLTRYGIYFAIGLVIILAATGRLHWLFALIVSVFSALIPLVRRFLPLIIRYLPFLAGLYRQAQAAKSTNGPTQGQTSSVETEFLRMTLDHDSGEMDGEILKGVFQGKRLTQLSQQQLNSIMLECQHDADSVALLEAFLDRYFGPEWRTEKDYRKGNENEYADKEMSNIEAYEILGLNSDATEQEIIAAHRRLIAKYHPDKGGSNYLAMKINQAKDILLKNTP